jgi:hypothetical protein
MDQSKLPVVSMWKLYLPYRPTRLAAGGWAHEGSWVMQWCAELNKLHCVRQGVNGHAGNAVLGSL